MTLTEILLVILVLAVVYATIVMRKRISQMDDFRKEVEKKVAEEQKRAEYQFDMPPYAVLSVRPPANTINPRVLELEKKLDHLYDDTKGHRPANWEVKEKEIIGKIVDIFMKEADKKVLSERIESHRSGSKK